MNTLNIALCQINTTVGDIKGNVALIHAAVQRASQQGSNLAIFPELTITGYPPEDLLHNRSFVNANLNALDKLCQLCNINETVAIVGFVERADERLYNAAAIIANGEIAAIYRKCTLPNYGVFDEQRYFTRGSELLTLELKGLRCGISICEDLWYVPGICDDYANQNIKLLINISASPYEVGKLAVRQKLLQDVAKRNNCFTVFVNQIGGQDELVFDGGSMAITPTGEIATACNCFESELRQFEVAIPNQSQNSQIKLERCDTKHITSHSKPPSAQSQPQTKGLESEIYNALVLGARDFLHKCGFSKAGVAVSGGIDSALVACIAKDALGAANVTAVSLPSRYSSAGSKDDARDLCKNLGIKLLQVPIEATHSQMAMLLKDATAIATVGVVDENLQARIRGVIMMALSNQHKFMVLATGNKSEMATGYATIFGDMVGGLAVLKDVLKTTVYELAHWLNFANNRTIIPSNILNKAPSAELRPNQLDQDSLPPYDELDKVLYAYVNEHRGASEILNICNLDLNEIKRIINMVDANEYKRRLSAPGIKITNLSFGKDRRLPIATGCAYRKTEKG